MTILKKYLNTLYYAFAFLLMVAVFYSNLFGILNPSFKNFQENDEGIVLSRLILTKHCGFFENSSLGGYFGEWDDPNFDHKEMYLKDLPFKKEQYNVYESQIGGQSMVYSALDFILPYDNFTKFNIFHFLTASFTALAFLFFLIWVKRHFGIITSIVTLFLIVLSFWIIIFSSKLWWNLWSFYLPFVFMLFYLDKKKSDEISHKKLFLYSSLLVFIKCFITGYDYISPALIMFTTPVLFYCILHQWEIKKAIRLFLKMSFGAISGFLVSIGILIFQISKLTKKEDNMSGLEYIRATLLERSYDDPNKHEGILYYKSMKSSIWEVIQLYLNGPAYKYKTREGAEYEVSFLAFILFFVCITFFYLYFKNKKSFFIEKSNTFNALIIMFWASIIAPLSWFVLFKGHSYIHTHINFIAWYMPFALLGYVLVGYLFSEIINQKRKIS
jgi:hypothetical protein